MSPVCRDETLVGLKNRKRNLGENMLTRIRLIRTSNSCYSTNFRLKTTLPAILLWQITYCTEEYSFLQVFFLLNKVSMLARLAGLMRLHGQI